MICPVCNGQKVTLVLVSGNRNCEHYSELRRDLCHTCQGTGELTEERKVLLAERDAAHSARVARRETLRDAAARTGMTVTEYSAWERGER